jgi:hypothetical protein
LRGCMVFGGRNRPERPYVGELPMRHQVAIRSSSDCIGGAVRGAVGPGVSVFVQHLMRVGWTRWFPAGPGKPPFLIV